MIFDFCSLLLLLLLLLLLFQYKKQLIDGSRSNASLSPRQVNRWMVEKKEEKKERAPDDITAKEKLQVNDQ